MTEDKSYGCCDYISELQKSFLKALLTAGQYFLFNKTSKLIVLVLQLCFLDHISSSWPADNETGGFFMASSDMVSRERNKIWERERE